MLNKILIVPVFFYGMVASVNAAPVELLKHIAHGKNNNLPAHVTDSFEIKANRKALLANEISIKLPHIEQSVVAVRNHLDRSKKGIHTWTGYVQGDKGAVVILTFKGSRLSGLIQMDGNTYRLTTNQAGKEFLYEVDLASLPAEEPDGEVPVGDENYSEAYTEFSSSADSIGVTQDLLVVYTQGACSYAGNCEQLEADIHTAVADMNNAYAASGVQIVMNLVGTHLTSYSGTNSSETLSALRSTNDGQMDEVHQVRDQLGADIVSLVYSGQGCGIGYLGASASTAFNVTQAPCMLGNRTMVHEIGHNQGAHHDRQTNGGGSSNAFNYGYRRCNDGSIDDNGAPYFRTIMSYSCASAPRVGIFSNPNVSYSGVPQGVDPDSNPDTAAWNARTLNESAAYVASFRNSQVATAPEAPSNLSTYDVTFNSITLNWSDNAFNEERYVVQRQVGGSAWQTIVTLAASTSSFVDSGLNAETLYSYRVRAENGAGVSTFTSTISANTLEMPNEIVDYAESDIAGQGQVLNNHLATFNNDNVLQSITESSSGGPKRSRRQSYQHTWNFEVTGGAGGVTFSANAWVSGDEGANFSYSVDNGTSWTSLFTVVSNSPDNSIVATLNNVQGNISVKVSDAESSNGESVDSVYVDSLQMISSTSIPELPAAPTDLVLSSVAPSEVKLEFLDNSDNELGFSLYRSTSDAISDCTLATEVANSSSNSGTGAVVISDKEVQPVTQYYYWVTAFNAGGESLNCSNKASVITGAAQAELNVNGYKQKGTQYVDLSWSGVNGDTINIYRDNQLVSTMLNRGNHTDNIGKKGGGSYTYKVCSQSELNACTNEQLVQF